MATSYTISIHVDNTQEFVCRPLDEVAHTGVTILRIGAASVFLHENSILALANALNAEIKRRLLAVLAEQAAA
jgi:hypothetical protein